MHIEDNKQYRHFKIFLKSITITINALNLKTKALDLYSQRANTLLLV